MLNKRFPVTIFILALTFSLVKSQNLLDSTSNVACPSNVSSPLECWFQSECLPCMVNDQQIQCVPFMSFGPNGEVLNGRDACKRINQTYGSYVPKLQDSLWGGLSLVIHKLIDRREMKLTSDDRLNISGISKAYYENVTQSLQTVRDLYNISSIFDMQSLVALTSNKTASLQSTINKTLSTLKNEWSLDAAQFESFINASQYEILEMRNIRKEAENCSLTNTTNSDLLVRDYYSLSSVFYCHATQRLQQFVTLVDQFSSLVENIQVVTLLNTYNHIGLLYENRYLCENSSASIPLENITTSNDSNSDNNNNVSNNINDNGYGNNDYYGNGYGNNNSNDNTSNNDTSSTSSNSTSNYNTSSCTWNNTLGYQMINAEHVKQSVAWYYLWEIEELRAYIHIFTSKLSTLVAKKCEEETYIGEYLDNVTLQNNSCANQTNFLSNTTLFNDTMDVLLDWMEDVDEVNVTYVNQNETEATNATLLFTVKRKINWDTQDLNNVSSEFCSSLIPYLNAFMGTEYDATWCEPSLAFIVTKPCSEVSSNTTSSNASSTSNSTTSNTTSSNVTSPNVTTSSNETSCDEEGMSSSNETSTNVTSSNETSTNVTSNVTSSNVTSNETSCDEVPSPSMSSSNETSSNVSSSNESSSNVSSSGVSSSNVDDCANSTNPAPSSNTISNETSENTTVPAPEGSTNEMNGTDCDNANVTSNNDTMQNGSSNAVNNTSSNTTSTSHSHKYSEIIFSIPVYLFPCNSTVASTNETIPSTNETVPSSNCTNTTIPATNETLPLTNSTNNTTAPANNETVPVPSSNCANTTDETGNIPVPASNEAPVSGGSTDIPISNETVPAPSENENIDCPETSPATGTNNGNGGTNTVAQFP